MKDHRKTQLALAGRFSRTEHTPEYSLIKCVGTARADSLTADEAEYIKGFYGYKPSAPHEIIMDSGNGNIKIYAE